jgi:hypothetical protein
MHGQDQATAPTGSPPPVVATTAPSQSRSDGHPPGPVMRVDFFLDPVGGWTCWIPRWPAEAQQSAEEHPTAWRQSRPGQRMLVGLLGRVGAWFGVCEQTPSGAWQRVHVPRRDPWEPGTRRPHSTVWSWWC